jgi:signal transduction histidine kinase
MALINDLLDISKIEAGQMDLQITEFDLVKLMEEIHEETRPLAEGRPIDYSCHLPSQPVLILADRMKLRQIIFNLLSNSFKATEHGAIDIQLSAPHADHSITLKVSDTGKGISPEDSRKLFQKFSNLDTYVDGKASTGLGLYLTLQLVKMHNGNISFESTPGKGTCFTVKLPLRLQTVDEVEAQT